MKRDDHTRHVTNAFLTDFAGRYDRATALKFPVTPTLNTRRGTTPYNTWPDRAWRIVGALLVCASAVGTGWAIMAVITRVMR